MKRLLIILLIFISHTAGAAIYYVSPTGSDIAAGTIDAPWRTWTKGFTSASAGDTVYFRGGIYYTTSSASYTVNGARDNPIYFLNYPGESPILDGINKTTTSSGVGFTNSNNLHIKGLTVRNNLQLSAGNQNGNNWIFYQCNNVTIENCVSANAGYRGFWLLSVDTMYVYNCDSYNAADSLSASPGNAGDGFLINDSDSPSDTTSYVILRGCRAWHNTDDGFDVEAQGYIELDNCWSFNNGYLSGGNGTGFKLSLTRSYILNRVTRRIINCVAAYNAAFGFDTNDNNTTPEYITAYNNTSYYNGYKGKTSYGYVVRNSSGTTAQELNRIFRNNASYANEHGNILIVSGASYTYSNNTWDASVTVTDADFLSVDSTGLSGARQADGSLPDLDFLRLAASSDLIDAGIDVGLLYSGAAPDLGFDEYDGGPSPATDILTFTFPSQTGAATINTTNHTVAIEVAYTADITNLTPTITLSYGATIIPTSGTARDFTNPVPYTVTAEDGVTQQEWTVTVTQEAEPEPEPVPSTGRIVKFNGKIVKR